MAINYKKLWKLLIEKDIKTWRKRTSRKLLVSAQLLSLSLAKKTNKSIPRWPETAREQRVFGLRGNNLAESRPDQPAVGKRHPCWRAGIPVACLQLLLFFNYEVLCGWRLTIWKTVAGLWLWLITHIIKYALLNNKTLRLWDEKTLEHSDVRKWGRLDV